MGLAEEKEAGIGRAQKQLAEKQLAQKRLAQKRLAWGYLLLAVVFEVAFALGTSASRAFTELWPSLFTVVTAAFGMFFLSRALRHIPVGVGYTVWVGLGAVGTVGMGALLFGEILTLPKIFCFLLIIGGCAGLRLTERETERE